MSKDANIIIPSKEIKVEDVTVDDLRHLGKDSFPIWCLTSGMKLDGHPVDFNRHRYLLPLYMDKTQKIAAVKAAQLGYSVYILARLIHFLYTNPNTKAGLYLPNQELAQNMSKDRLTPILSSIEDLKGELVPGDKLSLRQFKNGSSFYVLHLEGKSSKDSVPLDFVAFDEVRLVSAQSVAQATNRILHSDFKYELYTSTAGHAGQDIQAIYERGKQYVWMSKCSCPDGTDLARTFPDCVVKTDKRGRHYICVKCRSVIKDTQNGFYRSMNPGADFNSYSVSQIASKFNDVNRIWETYSTTPNMQDFYNSTLGLPYTNEDARGVNMADLQACVDPDLHWDKPKDGEICAMGVDQGGGYNMAVIYSTYKGKARLRHVEIIETNNPRYYENGQPVSPFKRLDELMREWNVKLCVIDAVPNYNESLAFAQRFPKRVFLAFYSRHAKDAIAWADKNKTPPTLVKSGPLFKFKYKVTLSRYLIIDATLGMWRDQAITLPPPEQLMQICRDEGTHTLQPESPVNRLFLHLCKAIRETKTDEKTMEQTVEWVFTNDRDHLVHASAYAFAALQRAGRAFSFDFC